MNRLPNIKKIVAQPNIGQSLTVNGWVRSCRHAGDLVFLDLTDGSSVAGLQVIIEPHVDQFNTVAKKLNTGSAVTITGTLVKSPAKGQAVELHAQTLQLIGDADPSSYPLQKKRHSQTFLRTISHLRSRTNGLAAITRIRSTLSFKVHQFFREHDFYQVHTPIITTSDCEGAGEMFQVQATDQDFFGRPAGLTVSGQLQAEIYALSHSRVYTFGPTFRAENSHTSRHLSEFWMVEPEMAFCDLAADITLAETLTRYLVQAALTDCLPELELLDRFMSKGLLQRLNQIASQPFIRMSYTEAINELAPQQKQFEIPVSWGDNLQSEHERFLCEQVTQSPLTLTNYPKSLKPFYMRDNDDGKTVAAMDLLVPTIGELIGGSQREERLPLLATKMEAAGLDQDNYHWYLDLRRFGSVPHAGFGLGFERMVQLVTGAQNIRETIAFPRTPGWAPC